MDTIGSNSPVALFLQRRGRELLLQYYHSDEIAHLDESIICARQALDASLPSERAVYLNDLGCRLHVRFERLGEIPDISEAIQFTEQASVTIGDSSKPVVLNNLATYLGERFDEREDVVDLHRGIASGQGALNASGSNLELRARSLGTLGLLHGHRFSKLGSLDDLENAIGMGEQGLQIMPQDHEDRPMQLENLGTYYERRYVRLGWRADIQKAIECAQEAVDLSDDDRERVLHLQNLSNALGSQYEVTNDPQDLQSAIVNAEQAVDSTPQDHPNWPRLLLNLSLLLGDRFIRFEGMRDLDRAIGLEDSAVDATSSDDPALAEHRDHAGVLQALQFDFRGDMSLLDASISSGQAAVGLSTDGDDPDLPGYLSNLAAGICRRFDRTNDLGDLERAIQLGRQALDTSPHDHPGRIDLLMDLGDYLHNWYIKLGSIEALEEAVKLTEVASKTELPYNFHRPHQLCNLSRRLRDRYECTRAVHDIQKSIELAQEAVDLVPSDHPRRVYCLHCLNLALEESFMIAGSLTHLDEAIKYSQATLAVSSTDHPDRATFLYHLSTQLVRRYEQFGALVDLEEAIPLMQESKENTPSNPSLQVPCLLGLSDQFGYCFERSHDMEKLNQAIDFAREAADLCTNGDMARVSVLNSMSLLLGSRFQKTGSRADLDVAVGAQREALKCAPDSYAQRDIILGNLSARMADLFRRTRRMSDLMEAIRLCREAIGTAPEHHPNRAMYLNRIGTLLKEDGAESSQDSAKNLAPLDYFLEALNHQNSPPLDRIQAGQNAFNSYVLYGEWRKAHLVARDAVNLFPLLVPRWLSRDDQQHLLGSIAHFTSSAASATLQANGSPADALEILEAGRGVIAGLTADLKADISKLEEIQPSLHADYTQLRRHILLPYASSFSHPAETVPSAVIPTKRKSFRRLSTHIATTGFQRAESLKKLEKLESKIRSIAGFEHFLERLTPSTYIQLARSGPIVAFNVTALRSDAVIVTSDGIDNIRLDRLQFDELKVNVAKVIGEKQLARGTPSTRPQRNEELQAIMHWLWNVAVNPVLTRLGLHQDKPPKGPLPRIWWVASGYMGLLPLHAAGTREYTAMDYVVSSYTPTLQVLKFSRERHHLLSRHADLRMLVVPAPKKPGQADLHTLAEIESIKEGLHEDISYTVLDRPSSVDVLRELPKHHLIHFSCHGSSNSKDPSSSALLLSPTPEDDAQSNSLLTVRDLSAINDDHAQIAYLSACSTAENSSDGLLDEIIHLVSAFQLAGFPHVVGTLWEVRDEAAVKVTGLFYRVLHERLRGVGGFRDGDVAYALHEALQMHRKSKRVMRSNDILSWAPFVYMGS